MKLVGEDTGNYFASFLLNKGLNEYMNQRFRILFNFRKLPNFEMEFEHKMWSTSSISKSLPEQKFSVNLVLQQQF